MKRKISWLAILITLVLLVSVGVTFAWIVASSRPVTNTFTVGNIEITLTESSGTTYKMVPGMTIKKDPVVTVMGGGDDCWLFVKAEKSEEFDSYITYEPAEGWQALDGEKNVYFRQVSASEDDTSFEVLEGNAIVVKETVTEQQLEDLSSNPSLTFYAYAIQAEGNYTVHTAWQNLMEKEE